MEQPLTAQPHLQPQAQYALRGLLKAWIEFEQRLFQIPIVQRIERGTVQVDDTLKLYRNLRAQVVEGSRWIARSASSFDRDHSEIRSLIIRHANDEHRDYRMLEQDYVALGGELSTILEQDRNLGSEALHSFMMFRASQPNPTDMLGAMFIIEGLGDKMASGWATALAESAGISAGDPGTRFLAYHGENDEHHMARFYEMLDDAVTTEAIADRVVKTARVVGRLYCLQLRELDQV